MSLKKYPLRGCDSEWGKQPYGVLSPSPNLPLRERVGEFRSLRRATRALPLTCQLLKKLDQNFNAGARRMRSTLIGYVCGNTVKRSVTYAGRTAGSSHATEAASSGVYCKCGDSPRNRLPEGNASGGSPPACKTALLFRRAVGMYCSYVSGLFRSSGFCAMSSSRIRCWRYWLSDSSSLNRPES